MSPKPFGKPRRRFWDLPPLARGSLIAVAAGPLFWLIFLSPARSYPTLAKAPFWWPAVIGFSLLIAVALTSWLKKRPGPQSPEDSSRAKIVLGRFFLSLFLAVPLGFLTAFFYEPALVTLNGAMSPSNPQTTFAFMERRAGVPALSSPYWGTDFSCAVHRLEHLPKEEAKTTLAKLTIRRGSLGAFWIMKIDYEYLK